MTRTVRSSHSVVTRRRPPPTSDQRRDFGVSESRAGTVGAHARARCSMLATRQRRLVTVRRIADEGQAGASDVQDAARPANTR